MQIMTSCHYSLYLCYDTVRRTCSRLQQHVRIKPCFFFRTGHFLFMSQLVDEIGPKEEDL